MFVFFFQAEDGIRDLVRSRGLGDVYKRQVSIDWTIAKFNDGFTAYKFNSLDYGVGAFVRAKFFHNFFAHLEYSQLNVTYSDGNVINNKLVKYREWKDILSVSYTHLRAHETVLDLVCRLLLEKKNNHIL